jgi:aerobic-type carbon monoxide dehydrogenase small subunit (CoxS/CutS family)
MIVNGVDRRIGSSSERSLLFVLREELGLTGAKMACGEGECGACTVLVDGVATRACRTTIGAIREGASIVTIEGLAEGGRLHPVQQAFLDEGALQCGFCTPGMIMSAVALLAKRPRPDDAAIVEAMNGNICRCCAYPRILRAVRRAAEGTP